MVGLGVGGGAVQIVWLGQAELVGHGVIVAPPVAAGVVAALPQAQATIAVANTAAMARAFPCLVVDLRRARSPSAKSLMPIPRIPFDGSLQPGLCSL